MDSFRITTDARKFFSPPLNGPLRPHSWLSETGSAPPPAPGSGLSPPADLWSHASFRQEVALSEWWRSVFRFPQKSSQRLCRNGHVHQKNVSGVFQRTTSGIKEGRNEGSKRPLKPLALLSEEFSPWSCHGDGPLEEGLRFVSQKQEVVPAATKSAKRYITPTWCQHEKCACETTGKVCVWSRLCSRNWKKACLSLCSHFLLDVNSASVCDWRIV